MMRLVTTSSYAGNLARHVLPLFLTIICCGHVVNAVPAVHAENALLAGPRPCPLHPMLLPHNVR